MIENKKEVKRFTYEDINAVFNEHGMACLLAYLLGNDNLYADNKFQQTIAKGIQFIESQSYLKDDCIKKG